MTVEPIVYAGWVGKKVQKAALNRKHAKGGKPSSPKPFKSRLRENTVKAVTINPHTNKPAFTFVEDDSIVDAYICELVP